jgi:predicted MFS family arabinose efflux permease
VKEDHKAQIQFDGILMSFHFTLALSFFFFITSVTGRVIITLYALKLGAQPFTVGVIAAMFAVLPTLLSWQVGRFSDRVGCRRLFMISTAAGFLGMLTIYVIPGIPALFMTSFMYGLMSALFVSPLQNLVGLQSGPRDRAKNYSNFSLVFSMTSFVGPMLAGFSFDHAGPGVVCLALALLSLVPTAMLAVWGGRLPGGNQTAKAAGSVRELLSESGLWRVLVTSSLIVMGFDMFQVYVPIYGYGIGLSASVIGIILAMSPLAAFAVRIFLPFLIKRLTAEKVLAFSFLIGAAGFMLVPFFKSLLILSLVGLLYGFSSGCGQPITLMMTFSNSDQDRSGEAMGIRITTNNLVRAVSQFLFGSICSTFGVFSVFWVCALMFASGWAFSHPSAVGRRQKGA